jgi:two-component system response regulator FixJ
MLEQEGIAVKLFENAETFLLHILPAYLNNSDFLGKCDVIAIIDIRMSGMDGLQLQENLIQNGIQIPLIFLTGYGSMQTCVKAIKDGVENFLAKPILRDTLMVALQSAFERCLDKRIIDEASNNADQRLAKLTEREWKVTTLAVCGHPNKEIACQLNLSYRTVEHHKSNIIRKTEARSLLDLANIIKVSRFVSESASVRALKEKNIRNEVNF